MSQWLIYLLIFIGGLLFTYIFQLCDLLMNRLANKQALHTSKIQKEINNMSGEETPQLEPAIGFHVQDETEYYEE